MFFFTPECRRFLFSSSFKLISSIFSHGFCQHHIMFLSLEQKVILPHRHRFLFCIYKKIFFLYSVSVETLFFFSDTDNTLLVFGSFFYFISINNILFPKRLIFLLNISTTFVCDGISQHHVNMCM